MLSYQKQKPSLPYQYQQLVLQQKQLYPEQYFSSSFLTNIHNNPARKLPSDIDLSSGAITTIAFRLLINNFASFLFSFIWSLSR